MHYGSIKVCDCANGPGMRTSLFVSGCSHHCKGCFNEVTWDYEYGEEFTYETLDYILKSLLEPHVQGISVLGGEPLDPKNQGVVKWIVGSIELFNMFKMNPNHKVDIWLYTGYKWEDIPVIKEAKIGDDWHHPYYTSNITEYILRRVDVIVDGPFIEAEKDISLKFRGSRNQRIIDVQKSLKEGKVILLEGYQ